jgi:histidinol-phosphate aminotransferase
MSNTYWSEGIGGLEPYRPGEQPPDGEFVKLNTNENPYSPSPAVLAALQRAANADLRLYPDPEGAALKHTIAAMHGLAPGNVFLGNGSDEVLAHAFRALLKHADPILYPDISYSFYPVYCALYEIQFRRVPLDEQFRVRVEDYLPPNGGVVLPNPNAPTGSAIGNEQIRRLLQQNPDSAVVIDEAYVDFGAESCIPLIREFRNLLVIQTLSKSRALAGLRVGFALGHPDLIEALARVKGSFNSYPLDRLALAGAQAALEDTAYFESTRRRIMQSRSWLAEALSALGFEVLPSAANFLFARHSAFAGAELQRQLRLRKILVRHFAQPRIADFVRISIGTQEECALLVQSLGQILQQPGTGAAASR